MINKGIYQLKVLCNSKLSISTLKCKVFAQFFFVKFTEPDLSDPRWCFRYCYIAISNVQKDDLLLKYFSFKPS
jgi:hypothetical protein